MKQNQFNPGRWLIFLSLAALLTLTGCSHFEIGRNGLKAQVVQPPPNAVVRVTGRSIGIRVGQNQATQTPEVQLGYESVTYDRVPTSTNRVYVAPVKAGIGVKAEGFGAGITETFETGPQLEPTNATPAAKATLLERISGKVCEVLDDVDGVDSEAKELLQVPPLIYFHIAHGKTFAGLNRRFTQERLVPSDAPFVWTLNQANLIRPDLRGTDAASTWLSLRRLGTATNNTNPDFPEWAVRNRAGYPVKLEPRILRGEVNLLSADTPPQYTVYVQHYEAFDRVSIIVQDGHWLLQTRAKDQGFDWQPLRFMVPGQTYVQIYEADFLPQEYRVIRAIE